MNIIISPAKKMNICNDDILHKSLPYFMDKSKLIKNILTNYSYENLKELLCCNDNIAELNFDRFKSMNLTKNLTPAILSYDGIQYKYMSPHTFSNDEFEYVNKHLKILSGFYGLLIPSDGVVPYRLEMQAKLKIEDNKNLYEFWSDSIYKQLTKENNIILNLASKEYSKVIEKYLTPEDTFITCIFGSIKDSKIKVKATEAKMARGLMVKYLAENNITDIEKVKDFSDLSFSFSKEYSTSNQFVFLK